MIAVNITRVRESSGVTFIPLLFSALFSTAFTLDQQLLFFASSEYIASMIVFREVFSYSSVCENRYIRVTMVES